MLKFLLLLSFLLIPAPAQITAIPGSGAGGSGGNGYHSFGATFVSSDGTTALTAGSTAYFVFPFACTIRAWNITVNAGTATVDIWKIASGTAIPTISNSITASNIPVISTGTSVHSTNTTSWTTTAVAANDIIGINLKVVATATQVNITVECS